MVTTNISISGRVTEREQERAVAAVEAALHDIAEPILRCTIRLEHGTDPHHVRLAVARLSVDVDGSPVLAHAEAETVDAAVETAAGRLHDQLRRRTDRRQDSQRRAASSPDGQWRHGDEKHAPTRYFERAHDERQIERHVSFAPKGSTVSEAIFDLEALGFDFLLFVEDETGDEAVVWRDPETPDGYVVRFAHGAENVSERPPTVEIDPHALPSFDIDSARALLDLGDEPFVAFRDAETDRGCVLHRRYDGHLGLVETPR